MVGTGIVIREYKTLKPKKTMCRGCRQNFYNGNNNLNVSSCWNFKDAKVCDKQHYFDINSTGMGIKKRTLHCWNGSK